MLPTVNFCGKKVTRLICGGNPVSGFSHFSGDLDREMREFYTMPRIQDLLDECWRQGINTYQTRGDRHQTRANLEYRLRGGQLQWIAQTAAEIANCNVGEIAAQKPIAIYHHGSTTDNAWLAGKIDTVHDIVKKIHDLGCPAGVGSHNPEVIEYIEEKGWETDFYMCCFYNLARGYKAAPAVDKDPYAAEEYLPEDPIRMTQTIRKVKKPCIGFKILAAGRNCASPAAVKKAFRFAFENIKPTDVVDVGMFQKHRNQVAENAGIVREILGC